MLLIFLRQSQRFLEHWLEENDVFNLCKEHQIKIVFWHLVDDGVDSQKLLERFIDQYAQQIQCVVVKNKGCGSDFRHIENLPCFHSQPEESHALVLQDSNALDQNPITTSATSTTFSDYSLQIKQCYLPELHSSTLRKIDRLNSSFWAATHAKEASLNGITMMESHRTNVWLQKLYKTLNDVLDNNTE